MNSFDAAQKELIDKAERAHYEGIRHKGLSGSVCEDLLIEALRDSFTSSRLNFDRGMIKFAAARTRGQGLAGAMSSQMDIMVYEGEPVYRTLSQAIVHISKVKGVVEIKKWTHSKMMRASVKEKIERTHTLLEQKAGRNIPLFFVTFRYHDRGNFENWRSAVAAFSTPLAYSFSGRFTGRGGVNLYPWQESWWNDFEHYPYRGQYERLVKDLSKLK